MTARLLAALPIWAAMALLLVACGDDSGDNLCPQVEGLCPAFCATVDPDFRFLLSEPPEICPEPSDALEETELFLGESTSMSGGCTVADEITSTASECGYARTITCADETREISFATNDAGEIAQLTVRLTIDGELCAYQADDVSYTEYVPPSE